MANEPTFTEGIIETEPGLIAVQDLSTFFYYFRAAYVEALSFTKEIKIYELASEEEAEDLAKLVARRIAVKGYDGIAANAKQPLPSHEDLYLSDIFRRNPIDVRFSCVRVALAVAVIISGGEIAGHGFKIKLPPLGTGIAEIKKVIVTGKPESKVRPSPNRATAPKVDDPENDDNDNPGPRS